MSKRDVEVVRAISNAVRLTTWLASRDERVFGFETGSSSAADWRISAGNSRESHRAVNVPDEKDSQISETAKTGNFG